MSRRQFAVTAGKSVAGRATAGPVEPRTTSSGSNSSSSGCGIVVSIWLTKSATAAFPIDSTGWRTVVSGGSVQFSQPESSNPTTETSPGTVRPARRTARIAPSARTSLPQMRPVTPCRRMRVVAA